MELIQGNIKAEWVRLGEGWNGDYDVSDPDDEELLRFDMSYKDKHGNWQEIPDASYCTRFPAQKSKQAQRAALQYILAQYCNAVNNHYDADTAPSLRGLGESLSWINEEDIPV